MAVPAKPKITPKNFHNEVLSWRDIKKVIKKTKIGTVEFNTPANALSIYCWANDNKIHEP